MEVLNISVMFSKFRRSSQYKKPHDLVGIAIKVQRVEEVKLDYCDADRVTKVICGVL